VLCLAAIGVPPVKAQLQPKDFDVPDGKIETAAGNRLIVSTKEIRATLKFPTQQNVTVKFAYLGPTMEVSHLGNGEVRSQFCIKAPCPGHFATSSISCGILLLSRKWPFRLSGIRASGRTKIVLTTVTLTTLNRAFQHSHRPFARTSPALLAHP
jgi:hypothetical protein